MKRIGKRARDALNSLSANERLILDFIWRYGPISRKSLADVTGLTAASTSRLTKHALSIGLIEESVSRSGSVGSPSRPLERASRGIFAVGVSFSKRSIECAVADLAGRLQHVTEVQVESVTIDTIVDVVRECTNPEKIGVAKKSRILGLGLAIPGYRARAEGEWAAHWDFPELLTKNIASELSHRLRMPVYAERDSIACLWSEHLNGAYRQLRNFSLLYLAQGVGGGVMADGNIIMGTNGNAGGLGPLFPYEAPRPSEQNLREYFKRNGRTIEDIDQAIAEAPELLDSWIDQVQPSLQEGLRLIARLYDPETIVLSGSLPCRVLEALADSVDPTKWRTNYTADLPVPAIGATKMEAHGRLLASAATLPFANILTGNGG